MVGNQVALGNRVVLGNQGVLGNWVALGNRVVLGNQVVLGSQAGFGDLAGQDNQVAEGKGVGHLMDKLVGGHRLFCCPRLLGNQCLKENEGQ